MQIDKNMIMEKAMAADMAEQVAVEEVAPSGTFSRNSMNRFIDSVNKLLKLFAAPAIAQVEEDVDGPMPAPLVKALMMFDAALGDAKMDEYMFDIADIQTDRDLMMVRGKIDSAEKDRAFRSFLAKPMGDVDEQEMEIEVSVGAPDEMEMTEREGMHRMPDGTMMKDEDMDEDEYFMSRMK